MPLLSPSSPPAVSVLTPHQSSNCGGRSSPSSPLTSPSANASTAACKHTWSDDSSSLAPAWKLKRLEWNNNQRPTGHLKAHDHAPEIYHLIVLAIHEFSVCVCTQTALPDPEVQITWANEVWTNTCKMVEEEYEVIDCVIGLVSSLFWFLLAELLLRMDFCQIKTCTSNACAPIKEAMHPLIEVVFWLKKTSVTTRKQAHCNIKWVQSALNGSYIYKVCMSIIHANHTNICATRIRTISLVIMRQNLSWRVSMPHGSVRRKRSEWSSLNTSSLFLLSQLHWVSVSCHVIYLLLRC